MDWKCLEPATFDQIKKYDGPIERHIEQLWDEIFRLRNALKNLENKIYGINHKNTSDKQFN